MNNENNNSEKNESSQQTVWLNTTINNPVEDFHHANRTNFLRRGFSTFFNQRPNSCPSVHSERQLNMNYSIRSVLSSPNNTAVININEIEMNNARRNDTQNQRRSSLSIGASDSFAREIVPELSNFAAHLFNSNNSSSRHGFNLAGVYPLINNQRNATLNPENSTVNPSLTESSSTFNNTQQSSSTSNSNRREENSNANNSDEADQHNLTIPPLRVILQNREAFGQYIYQNFNEFPTLHGFNVFILFVVVLATLFSQFLIDNFTACGAFFLGLLHYQDSSRFMRSVSSSSDVHIVFGGILLRNAMILYIFDKRFILSVAIFKDAISHLSNPTFFSTAYRIISAELFVMDVILLFKLAIFKNPMISKIFKRRIYQWLEYSSVLYRYPIPFIQWSIFFGNGVWIIIYFIAKLLIGFPILWAWIRTTLRLFRYSHLGTLPTLEEIKNAEQCTICYGNFNSSIKLNCGHLFCSDCIRTWLDREVTCPICRATVTKEDNLYRNGNSIFPMHIF